jgi:hypothetical protein
MGTSQRISPGVPGDGNWGSLSRSITQIAKTVEREKEEDEKSADIENSTNQEEVKKSNIDSGNLLTKRRAHLTNSFKSLVRTAGGASQISKGRSRSLGHAGLKSARKITSFIVRVGSSGLAPALKELGFDLTGKNLRDVLDFLLVYTSDSNAGMDEMAANRATCEILDDLAAKSGQNLEQFEENIKRVANDSTLPDILCDFWGYYIFEHLSQRFYEKITQQRGIEISVDTFKIIKEDILGQVRRLNEKNKVVAIDWKGDQGKNAIEEIFRSIIKILCDED